MSTLIEQLYALVHIKHSIQQARIPGNDWRRELALIEGLVDVALAVPSGPREMWVNAYEDKDYDEYFISREEADENNEASIAKRIACIHMREVMPGES